MRDDLRRRLRQLGVVKGTRGLANLPSRPAVAIEDVTSGRYYTTSHGRCFIVEESYAGEHRHGNLPLSSYLALSPEEIVRAVQDDALSHIDWKKACFIDTETTGLSGGTGTMAFVVGIGFFEDEQFQVQQYFLRDPGDEPAMVEALAERLPEFDVLVSFNGRAFDVPILENRFILARMPPPTGAMAHLDLLPLARSLWRYALPSCSLGTIEQEVLGVRREQADVPGGEIPYLYRDYLRTGDARDMKRVLYHNVIDVLSMVTLAARLCRRLVSPWDEIDLKGPEFYALARRATKQGAREKAEQAYRSALEGDLDLELRLRTLRSLALLLKREDRRDEAYAYWQQMALETDPSSRDFVRAHVELAIYFEWHVEDLERAAEWTESAIAAVETWRSGYRRREQLEELRHRLDRLRRKMAAG